jgi:hypothetical protein
MKFNSSPNHFTNANASAVHDAVASIHVKGWMQNVDEKTSPVVSVNERTSLSALIAYVAQKSGENEFRVERRLSDRFNVANMTCLPSVQFDNAIRYLVDGLQIA